MVKNTLLKKAVGEQQDWLDKTLVPNAKGDFRIGAKLYDQKLQFALMSSLTRGEIRVSRDASSIESCWISFVTSARLLLSSSWM